jgi:hypothetical protein
MRRGMWAFAIGKPAFWGQKNKDENEDAKNVPLPRVSGIGPKEGVLDQTKNKAHRFTHQPPAKQFSNRIGEMTL